MSLEIKSWGEQPCPEIKHSIARAECPHCGFDPHLREGDVMDEPHTGLDNLTCGRILGFSTDPYLRSFDEDAPWAIVYECRECFQKFWTHVMEEKVAWLIEHRIMNFK